MTKRILISLLALALGLAALAVAARAADAPKTLLPLDGTNARLAESTLADVQAAQVRNDLIPAGPLADDALTRVLLYPDEPIVAVELRGQTVLDALERSLCALPQPSTGFLQVSGLTLTFRSAGPAGQRLDSVKVGQAPLVSDKVYRVAMPSSLAKGALGYFRIFNALEIKQTGPGLGPALLAYVHSVGVISLEPDRRLRDLTPPKR
jgi:2',3'-cyclic-nucleotide 2'-phosphodiesterase (5'-nucleotidase family)